MEKKDPDNLPEKVETQKQENPDATKANVPDGTVDENGFTQVKNAHASGLGSMGRNDEKLDEESAKS